MKDCAPREDFMGKMMKPAQFERQANNFGTHCEVMVDVEPKCASTKDHTHPTNEKVASPSDLGEISLFKVKPKKKKVKQVFMPNAHESFNHYADEILGGDDLTVQREIQRAKEEFAKSGLPQLRVALSLNTMDCIRVVFWAVLNYALPTGISKAELVGRCVSHVRDRFWGDTSSFAHEVGDFGIVIDDIEELGLAKGKLVLLKTNSKDNTGAPCVTSTSYEMLGWVYVDGEVKQVELKENQIKWGELFLHKKVSLKDLVSS